MERFQGTKDYKLNMGVAVLTTGTDSGTAIIDVGEYAEQVDLITQIDALGTSTVEVTVFQNSTSAATGSSTMTLPPAFETQTQVGQKKTRLQPSWDTASWYPWLGPVDGRYLFIEVDVAGAGTSQVLAASLTIQSREYPVE